MRTLVAAVAVLLATLAADADDGSPLQTTVGSLLRSYDSVKLRGGAEDVTEQICPLFNLRRLKSFTMPGDFWTKHGSDAHAAWVTIGRCDNWLCLTGEELFIGMGLWDDSCHAQINPTGFGVL